MRIYKIRSRGDLLCFIVFVSILFLFAPSKLHFETSGGVRYTLKVA